MNKVDKQPRECAGNHPRVQSTVGSHKTNRQGLAQRLSSYWGRDLRPYLVPAICVSETRSPVTQAVSETAVWQEMTLNF